MCLNHPNRTLEAIDAPEPPTISPTAIRMLFTGEGQVRLEERLAKDVDKVDQYYQQGVPKKRLPLYAPFGQAPLSVEWRRVVARFSATTTVKTYSRLREQAVKHTTWQSYKKSVSEYLGKVNKAHLQTEFVTLQSSVNNSFNYNEMIDNDTYSSLEYSAVLDDRTRDEHAELHGTIRPKDDPFWDDNYPPNGWNCRCIAIETNESITTTPDTTGLTDPDFRGNVGKEAKVTNSGDPGDSKSSDSVLEREINRGISTKNASISLYSALTTTDIRKSLTKFGFNQELRYIAFVILSRLDEWLDYNKWQGKSRVAFGKFGEYDVEVNIDTGNISISP